MQDGVAGRIGDVIGVRSGEVLPSTLSDAHNAGALFGHHLQ